MFDVEPLHGVDYGTAGNVLKKLATHHKKAGKIILAWCLMGLKRWLSNTKVDLCTLICVPASS